MKGAAQTKPAIAGCFPYKMDVEVISSLFGAELGRKSTCYDSFLLTAHVVDSSKVTLVFDTTFPAMLDYVLHTLISGRRFPGRHSILQHVDLFFIQFKGFLRSSGGR